MKKRRRRGHQERLDDYMLWRIHFAAKDEAKRKGACRRCQYEWAFAATDKAMNKPAAPDLHDGCRKLLEGGQ